MGLSEVTGASITHNVEAASRRRRFGTMLMRRQSSLIRYTPPMADSPPTITWSRAAVFALVAAAAYAMAFATRTGGGAILVALPCLFMIPRVQSSRGAFYLGGLCGQ